MEKAEESSQNGPIRRRKIRLLFFLGIINHQLQLLNFRVGLETKVVGHIKESNPKKKRLVVVSVEDVENAVHVGLLVTIFELVPQ